MSYSKDRDKHSYAGERGREGKREREGRRMRYRISARQNSHLPDPSWCSVAWHHSACVA